MRDMWHSSQKNQDALEFDDSANIKQDSSQTHTHLRLGKSMDREKVGTVQTFLPIGV